MTVEPSGDSTTSLWSTRSEEPADRTAVRAVNLAAFETAVEADLVEALRADPAWTDGLSWVALNDVREVIGYALLTRCAVGTSPALCMAPCAVGPRYQGRGVGTAVITAALGEARTRGEEFVVVLGHPDYYPRFGFQPAVDFGITVTFDVPEEALMVLRLSARAEIPSGVVCFAEAFDIPC